MKFTQRGPSYIAPYSPGKLGNEFLNDGLKMTNFVRYLSEIPYDLVLDQNLTGQAQYGATLERAVGQLTHYPIQLPDMSDDFFNKGYKSTTSSNIGYGFSSISDSIKAYMSDSDMTNIDRIGHRRWLLNPGLKKIGFGYADGYTTTQVFDNSRNTATAYDSIMWPNKGNFPVDFFAGDDAWSITLNPLKYKLPLLSLVSVNITKQEDGETWVLNNKTDNSVAKDYFNVNTDGYGVSNCIIFRPGNISKYSSGDIYNVIITGIEDINGNPCSIKYKVNFFNL